MGSSVASTHHPMVWCGRFRACQATAFALARSRDAPDLSVVRVPTRVVKSHAAPDFVTLSQGPVLCDTDGDQPLRLVSCADVAARISCRDPSWEYSVEEKP